MSTHSDALRRLEEALRALHESAYALQHVTQRLEAALRRQHGEADRALPLNARFSVDPDGRLVIEE